VFAQVRRPFPVKTSGAHQPPIDPIFVPLQRVTAQVRGHLFRFCPHSALTRTNDFRDETGRRVPNPVLRRGPQVGVRGERVPDPPQRRAPPMADGCSGAAARPRPRRTASRGQGPARRARRAARGARPRRAPCAWSCTFGTRISTRPASRRCTCRRTCTWRRRKSTSLTCKAAASPSRRPANAHIPTKARNLGSEALRMPWTTSGVGMVIAASRFRSRGSRTWAVGSVAIIPSRTAARKTERTLTKRVLIVPGVSGRGRAVVGTVMDFTHASTWLGRTSRRSTAAKVGSNSPMPRGDTSP